jgi:hypothetical protein
METLCKKKKIISFVMVMVEEKGKGGDFYKEALYCLTVNNNA